MQTGFNHFHEPFTMRVITMNITTMQNQIDKASSLAEVIRSRTDEGSVNRNLADLLIDSLLNLAAQVDGSMHIAEKPIPSLRRLDVSV